VIMFAVLKTVYFQINITLAVTLCLYNIHTTAAKEHENHFAKVNQLYCSFWVFWVWSLNVDLPNQPLGVGSTACDSYWPLEQPGVGGHEIVTLHLVMHDMAYHFSVNYIPKSTGRRMKWKKKKNTFIWTCMIHCHCL
jgi:hypothetical protein